MARSPYRADGERRVYRGGGWAMNSWSQDWTILQRGNFAPRDLEKGKVVGLAKMPIGIR